MTRTIIDRISGVSSGGHMTAIGPTPSLNAQLITERPSKPALRPFPPHLEGLMRRAGLTEMPPVGMGFRLVDVNRALDNAGFRQDERISLKARLSAAGLL